MASQALKCVHATLQRFQAELPTATTSGLRTPKLSSGAIEGGGSSSGGGGGGSSVSGSGAGGGGGASNGIGSGEAIVQTKRCVVGLSGGAYFSTIVAGLAESAKGFHSSHMSTTGKLNVTASDNHVMQSLFLVLQTIKECMEKRRCSGNESGCQVDQGILESTLLPTICQLLTSSESSSTGEIRATSSRLLFYLCAENFDVILSRMRSSFASLVDAHEDSTSFKDVLLIEHLDLNSGRLEKLLFECSSYFSQLKRSGQYCLCSQVVKAILNWVKNHPREYNNLLKSQLVLLTGPAMKLFEDIDRFANSDKRRNVAWPLKILLLLICPHFVAALEEEKTKHHPEYQSKIDFLFKVIESLSSGNRTLVDAAVESCVYVCRLCTYVNRQDTAVIKYIVTLFQSKLQDVLFNPKKVYVRLTQPAIVGSPPDERELMIHCLIALFRINPRNNYLSMVCLESTSPLLFKLILVRSIHRVVQEGMVVGWWPSADVFFSFSQQLRTLFQGFLEWLKLRHPLKQFGSRSKLSGAEKKSFDSSTKVNYELGRSLLELLKAEPACYFQTSGASDSDVMRMEILKLVGGVASLVQHPCLTEFGKLADEVLLRLMNHETVESWNPSQSMSIMWEVSSHVCFSLSTKLTGHKSTDVTGILRLLQNVLIQRNLFLEEHQIDASIDSDTELCHQTQTQLEVVLLSSLWSPQPDVVLTALRCIYHLCKEVEIKGNANEISDMPINVNLTTFRGLANLASAVRTGRVAQQKKIWHLLRQMHEQTLGNTQSWDDTLCQWQAATSVLTTYKREPEQPAEILRSGTNRGRQSSSPSPVDSHLEKQYIEWLHMTGFLCSLGGVFAPNRMPSVTSPGMRLVLRSRNNSEQSLVGNRPRRSSRATSTLFEVGSLSSMDSEDDPLMQQQQASVSTTQLAKFASDLVDLLVCGNETFGIQIREGVRDLIGHELHPALYSYLYDQIREKLRDFFSSSSRKVVVSDLNSLFGEQVISVGKMMMESKLENVTQYFEFSRLESTITTLGRYAQNLDTSSHKSLVLRVKFCQLIEAVMKRRQSLTFRHEIPFRNKLLDNVSNWAVVSQGDSSSNSAAWRDLKLSSVRAVTALLEGLPLQPENTDSDQAEEKSKLFLKYFTLLMKILDECKSLESGAHPEKDAIRQIATLSRHLAGIRTYAVTAMSNLLSANIETGLVHALGLAYNEDVDTRVTFMEVLTKVLKQGTEFGTLSESVLTDRYSQLMDVLSTLDEQGQMPIAMSLIDAIEPSELEDLLRVILIVCDSRGLLAELVAPIFSEEVENTDSAQTLFRGNSLASKLIAVGFQLHGMDLLQAAVKPQIDMLLKAASSSSSSTSTSYEVDPARLPDDADIEGNQARLLQLATSIFDSICREIDRLPLQLRVICNSLHHAVEEEYPTAQLSAIGSSLFLRFINPALVLPSAYNLVHGDVPRSVKRTLMLASKILQNLANNVEFKKEQHMLVFNDFLTSNFSRAQKLFSHLATLPQSKETVDNADSRVYVKEADKILLHQLLWTHQEKIESDLLRLYHHQAKGIYEPLAKLLAQIGQPDQGQMRRRAMERKMSTMDLVSSPLDEYLASAGVVDEDQLESVKASQIFYREGKAKNGNAVCYYVARKFRPEIEQHSELLLYYILLTLRPLFAKSWELVIDLTGARRSNAPKVDYLSKLLRVIPPSGGDNLAAVYLYNCNTWAKQYLKHCERLLSSLRASKKMVFVDSLAKLHEFIEPSSLKLPASTLAHEETTRVFSNVGFSTVGKVSLRSLLTTMRLTSQSFCIVSNDKVRVLGHSVVINDTYHVSELEEATVVDANTLSIKTTDGMPTMRFTSPEAEQIVQAINHGHSRWRMGETDVTAMRKNLRPDDVPGTLLNMALLNLGSADPSLRLAAYNLLCALTASFHLQIGRELTEAQGVCIPSNNTIFIKNVSALLASSEPHLTLEFLEECVRGFQSSSSSIKSLCLQYMAPWLPNLARFIGREKEKVMRVLQSLIDLTVKEKEIYPSIQADVWGTIGHVPDLLDTVLESFLRESTGSIVGSEKVEVIADTTISLATADTQSVSREIIRKMIKLSNRTWSSPTARLEQHILWDELVVLTRYLLMLSFNNRLDVVNNLPDLFYLVTLISDTGPVFIRASVHCLVCNIVHSLCTCASQLQLLDDTVRSLQARLNDLSQPKFYLWFGISEVKLSAASAFQFSNWDKAFAYTVPVLDEHSVVDLVHLQSLTEFLLEIAQLCMKDMNESSWLSHWEELVEKAAFKYNPALQPRALVTLGSIAQTTGRTVIDRLLIILHQSLETFCEDTVLICSILMCLAKLVTLLPTDSGLHPIIFWSAVLCLELDEENTYSAAIALLEATLKTMDANGSFDVQTMEAALMATRKAHELNFSQLDKKTGLSFTTDFSFALASLLMKGLYHPNPLTTSDTSRLIHLLRTIGGKGKRTGAGGTGTGGGGMRKSDLTAQNLPFYALLFSTSEEVRYILAQIPTPSRLLGLRTRSSRSLGRFPFSFDELEGGASASGDGGSGDGEDARQHYPSLVNRALASDLSTQVLLLMLLINATLHATNEKEVALLLNALADAGSTFRQAFSMMCSVLLPKIERLLSQSQNFAILRAAQELVELSSGRGGDGSGEGTKVFGTVSASSYLNEIGFLGLFAFDRHFTPSSQVGEMAQMVRRTLGRMAHLEQLESTSAFTSLDLRPFSIVSDDSTGAASPETIRRSNRENLRSCLSLSDVSGSLLPAATDKASASTASTNISPKTSARKQPRRLRTGSTETFYISRVDKV
ncbi:neurofibromin-like [Oscarella lobularis]|uniref:neurofibromin-like n=1 Tax=Oscarella lobularis TaxID=121494 RepID=UPI0033141542